MSNAPLNIMNSDCVSPEELRRAPRQRTLRSGRVAINKVFSTIDVVVRDISDTGARIRLAQPMVLPKTFSLVIFDANTSTYRTIPAKFVWQRGVDIGVEFIGEEKNETFSKKNGTLSAPAHSPIVATR